MGQFSDTSHYPDSYLHKYGLASVCRRRGQVDRLRNHEDAALHKTRRRRARVQ